MKKKLALKYSNDAFKLANEWIAGASHEVDNLLTMVQGSASILVANDMDDASREAMVQSIQEKTDKISQVLLGLRKLTADFSDEDISNFAVEEVISTASAFCKTRFRNHRIFLAQEVDSNLAIKGKSGQLVQALLSIMNVAHNQIAKNNDRWILVDSEVKGAMVNIYITCSSKKMAGSIEDYIQNHSSDSINEISLIMARSIIEENGGQVAIDDEAENFKFIIKLPRSENLEAVILKQVA